MIFQFGRMLNFLCKINRYIGNSGGCFWNKTRLLKISTIFFTSKTPIIFANNTPQMWWENMIIQVHVSTEISLKTITNNMIANNIRLFKHTSRCSQQTGYSNKIQWSMQHGYNHFSKIITSLLQLWIVLSIQALQNII